MKTRIVLLIIMLLIAAPIKASDESSLPDKITLNRRDLMPEGIEYDAQGERFLLSSMAEGTVFAVADDGSITPFIEDEDLIASIGLEIDEADDRLLVVNADLNVSNESPSNGAALLGIYDLTTGERLHMVDLDDLLPEHRHFANDVALDDEGNAYVTDSLAPVIYKVTAEGEASILLQNDGLLIDGFSGNGIVYHPDGYLLVGISGLELYKVPLDDPAQWTQVDTSEVIAADGMLLNSEGDLLVVSEGSILTLNSADNWISADVTNRVRNHPATTIAFRGDAVYALHPQASAIVQVQFKSGE